MEIKQQIETDLKSAMIKADKEKVNALRNLKSALQYAEVASNKRAEGLSHDEVIVIIQKEVKKRQESADLYIKGGSPERAGAELAEKKILEEYLPQQLSDEEVMQLISESIISTDAKGLADMGKVIAAVKNKAAGSVDGAIIAKLTKEKLSS
jgi:uncharacterized protein